MEAELSSLLKSKVHECVSLQQVNKGLMEQLVALQTQLAATEDSLKAQNDSEGDTGCLELQTQVHELKQDLSRCEAEKRALHKELEQRCGETNSTSLEMAYQAELETKTKEMDTLRRQYETSRQQWEDDRAKMTATIADMNRALDAKVAATGSETKAWLEERKQLGQQIHHMEQDAALLRSQLTDIKCRILHSEEKNTGDVNNDVIFERIDLLLEFERRCMEYNENASTRRDSSPTPQPTSFEPNDGHQEQHPAARNSHSPTEQPIVIPSKPVHWNPLAVEHNHHNPPRSTDSRSEGSIENEVVVDEHTATGGRTTPSASTPVPQQQGQHPAASIAGGLLGIGLGGNANTSMLSNTSFDTSLLDMHIENLIQQKLTERLGALSLLPKNNTNNHTHNTSRSNASSPAPSNSHSTHPVHSHGHTTHRSGLNHHVNTGHLSSRHNSTTHTKPSHLATRTTSQRSETPQPQRRTTTHPTPPHSHHNTSVLRPANGPSFSGSSAPIKRKGPVPPIRPSGTTVGKPLAATTRTNRAPPSRSETPPPVKTQEEHDDTLMARCTTPSHLHVPLYHSKPPTVEKNGRPSAPVFVRRTSATTHGSSGKSSDSARGGRPIVKQTEASVARVRSRSAPQFSENQPPSHPTCASPVPLPTMTKGGVITRPAAVRAPRGQMTLGANPLNRSK
eukprot:TRINITY_DN63904_c0_g2_i1.p1 TRINITY_DN63904_c0_g2~~TRINITY_DN63904_c0_g2_i1.p1  ORF type:complete len:700 (-),score=96.62 TRINITY_DN63904_c0_g2_i1:1473-3506(-)